jgi:hypothetical protein
VRFAKLNCQVSPEPLPKKLKVEEEGSSQPSTSSQASGSSLTQESAFDPEIVALLGLFKEKLKKLNPETQETVLDEAVARCKEELKKI